MSSSSSWNARRKNLRAVTDVGANRKVADLLIMLFEEVVASRTHAGSSKRAVTDVEPIHAIGCSSLSHC